MQAKQQKVSAHSNILPAQIGQLDWLKNNGPVHSNCNAHQEVFVDCYFHKINITDMIKNKLSTCGYIYWAIVPLSLKRWRNWHFLSCSIQWRYATPCCSANDCKISDLGWPWLAVSCQNPFSASIFWTRAFECHKITQPLRFCRVLCLEPPSVIIRR